MNILEKSIEYISKHPHFNRGHDGRTKLDLKGETAKAWENGWLNFIYEQNSNLLVGIFMAFTINKDGKNIWIGKYPEMAKAEDTTLFMPMVHITPGYTMPFTYMYKILYKVAEIGDAQSLFFLDGKKRVVYHFNKRRYTTNGSLKYLILNKNTWFEV